MKMKKLAFYAVLAIFAAALAFLTGCADAVSPAPQAWTVTFDKNNDDPGSTEANPTSAGVSSSGGTIGSLPEAPTRTGYTFTFWRSGSGALFTGNTPVTGDITVYAQWVINKYAVLFDANGATSGAAPAGGTYDYNTPISIPNGPGLSKPGYNFSGWNTQRDGEGTKYVSGDSYTVTDNARLYAHWEVIPHDPLNELLAEVFDELHIANPLYGRMYVHGTSTPDVVPVRGSVISYMFDDLYVDTTKMMPLSNTARPGTIRSQTKYIIYHDTANTSATAGALTHANLQYNNNSPNASWHYTVDHQSIYQSIPNNEVAWHAGGAEGNQNSIGIETCVNWGTSSAVYMSDFFQTWQRMGKLVASLLDQYGLQLSDVLSHKEISVIGYNMVPRQNTYHKCCPQTLRHAVLWNMAKELIRCEFLYLEKIQKPGYTAQIIVDPDYSEYIDAKGRVKKLPPVPTTVYYTIRLTAPGGESREKIYSSLLSSQSADYIGRCDITVGTCSVNQYTSLPAGTAFSAKLSTAPWRSSIPAGHIHDPAICDITWSYD